MAITYDTTTGLRALLGGNLVSDIDTGFLSLAQDSAAALGHAMQEGVKDAGSFETTQASGGASLTLDIASNVGTGAMVQNDSATGLPLVYLPPTGSKSTVTVTAAHATLPRVDSVYVTTAGVVTYIAGTATSGATLDNARDGSHGGATIPSNALHLADLLVAATATSIANSAIRDRRRWARGAFNVISRTSGYTTASNTDAAIDATNINPRIECSGAPLRLTLQGEVEHSDVTGVVRFGFAVDGSNTVYGQWEAPAAGEALPFCVQATITPSAGSHRLAPYWSSLMGIATASINTRPLIFTVEEVLRQNVANNATTSG